MTKSKLARCLLVVRRPDVQIESLEDRGKASMRRGNIVGVCWISNPIAGSLCILTRGADLASL